MKNNAKALFLLVGQLFSWIRRGYASENSKEWMAEGLQILGVMDGILTYEDAVSPQLRDAFDTIYAMAPHVDLTD